MSFSTESSLPSSETRTLSCSASLRYNSSRTCLKVNFHYTIVLLKCFPKQLVYNCKLFMRDLIIWAKLVFLWRGSVYTQKRKMADSYKNFPPTRTRSTLKPSVSYWLCFISSIWFWYKFINIYEQVWQAKATRLFSDSVLYSRETEKASTLYADRPFITLKLIFDHLIF